MIPSSLHKSLSIFADLGEYLRFTIEIFCSSVRKIPSLPLLYEQLYRIGILSLPLVAITGLSTGLVLATQSFYQLGAKGFAGAAGIMVAKPIISELGPILTAFMVTGRVGACICAELSAMTVTEQISAFSSLSTNPIDYLVVPRFISCVIMMPLLTIFNIIMGILGGYAISVYFFHMPMQSFLRPIQMYIANFDIAVCLIKSIVFSVLIITISCYKGLTTRGGALGVGKSITRSVVLCYSSILLINFLMTLGFNIMQSRGPGY